MTGSRESGIKERRARSVWIDDCQGVAWSVRLSYDPAEKMATTEDIVVGIDLGTTYSCAAYVQDGRPRIIPSEKGYTTVPSVVGLSQKGEVIVGHVAMDQMI